MQDRQLQLALQDSTGFSCSNCNGIFFKQSFLIRKWSKILTGTPQDYVDLVPAFRCEDCGEILKDMFPRGMQDVESILGIEAVTEPKIKIEDYYK